MMQTTPEYVDLEFKMRCFGVFGDKNRKKFCFHLQKQGLHPDDAVVHWRAHGHGHDYSQEQEPEQERRERQAEEEEEEEQAAVPIKSKLA